MERPVPFSPRRPGGARPAVIILGGGANALSIARSLGRYGLKVFAINQPGKNIQYSRYAEWIPVPPDKGSHEEAWARYLLGPASDHLRGAVLLAASDPALELLARHRPALLARFRLDASNPEAQLCMLNKLRTYEAATAAGVATPRFWVVRAAGQLERLRPSLVFPLLVKPQLSHVFVARFGKKFFIAEDFEQLTEALVAASDAGIEVLLMELIPGPDELLSSYYTYLDEDGSPLFHFTKRIIRRFPPGMGGGCYHVTDEIPELREPALRLFRHVGLRGLANVEFKLDPRDGQRKLIECNARFTAANCLVARAGFDLARFVYNRVVGLPQPPLTTYRRGLRLWYPLEDLRAFRALHRRGELSAAAWAKSLLHPQTLPLFEWSDPLPSLMELVRALDKVPRSESAPGPPG
jgi:D-aspartate ligase